METNIRKNSNSKTISLLRVLIMLTRLRAKSRQGKGYLANSILNAVESQMNPAEIFAFIKDVSLDNPTAVIEAIGEDLFNDFNAVQELPTCSWYDLTNRRNTTILSYGGRNSGRSYLQIAKSKANEL